MINSMTGFSRIHREVDGISYAVEIKTVNNRYFKPSLKVPESAGFLETEIEKLLRSNIHRGSVSYTLRFKSVSGEPMFEIDTALITGYLDKLGKIGTQSGIDNSQCRINLADLLTLPGVVRPEEPEPDKAEKMRNAVLQITSDAIAQLKQMRSEEGAVLADDMQNNCDLIKGRLEGLLDKRDVVIKEYHEKLKNRVAQLLDSARLELDSDTLAREVAIFADRSDIAEEVTRLGAHIEQFVANCKQGSNVGRKLDFITQEMLREANTIASKASDSRICLEVVEMKSCIERIKEQVQNVE
ncbi:MAG: YicC family protein [Anaerohalosphaeraceae bacterium]|nr:YicC family protein [Anaerohalosphaeraceae bacterium]